MELSVSRLDAYLPPELQARLREASTGLRGEKRPVTFLFADLVGSTTLAEAVDLELLKVLLDRVLGLMVEAVVQHEGTVARLQGDGLLAFFGAPLIHEDDAERALHAALALQSNLKSYAAELGEALARPVEARVGVNGGEVLVGELGSDLRLEYTAVGDAINVAARLQVAAPPGGILAGEPVYREARLAFEFGEPVSLELKGKQARVRAYPVLRARPEPGPRRGLEGLASPLVGRQAELAQLGESLGEVRAGRGQIVLVVGEAGIGKSRLAQEGRELGSEGWRWAEGRCLSYGRNLPFHPFVDALKELVGIGAGDSGSLADLKLRRGRWPGCRPKRARGISLSSRRCSTCRSTGRRRRRCDRSPRRRSTSDWPKR